MDTIIGYLNRLREIVPARTLGFYVSANGIFAAFGKPSDIPAALIFAVLIAALAVHIIGGFTLKRPAIAVLLSAIAFVLLACSQPFYGPLAALGVLSGIPFLIIAILAITYLTILPMVYTGDLAAQG